jgi:hypothetical protein
MRNKEIHMSIDIPVKKWKSRDSFLEQVTLPAVST